MKKHYGDPNTKQYNPLYKTWEEITEHRPLKVLWLTLMCIKIDINLNGPLSLSTS